MRRTLAVAALAAVAVTASPASAARDLPPRGCDIFQNCICSTANYVLYTATGEYWLLCH